MERQAATFDMVKLGYINGQHIKALSSKEILKQIDKFLPKDTAFKTQDSSWQEEFVDLLKKG